MVTPTQIRIPDDLKTQATLAAANAGQSFSAWVREAMEAKLHPRVTLAGAGIPPVEERTGYGTIEEIPGAGCGHPKERRARGVSGLTVCQDCGTVL